MTKKECDGVDFGTDLKRVDYKKLYDGRFDLLHKAYERAKVYEDDKFADFVYENSKWLWDYALFMALKDYFNGEPFNTWPKDIRERYDYAINYYREKLYFDIEFYQFLQYKFAEQWKKLKAYTDLRPAGVAVFGDEKLDVVTDGDFIEKGNEIVIIRVEGMRIVVKKI